MGFAAVYQTGFSRVPVSSKAKIRKIYIVPTLILLISVKQSGENDEIISY